MKLDGLIQSPIYNRDSVSVNSVFLLSSYKNIPFMMIFLLLLLRKKHFSSALLLVFSCGSSGKESACNVGDLGSVPALGRFPWRREQLPTPVFWSGEFMDCIVHGVANSQTWLSEIHFHFSRFSGWSSNQIDIRQINKRTIYLITYLPTRTPQGQWYPRTSQAVETWMLFWTKEWDRVLDLERGRGCFTGW